MVRNLFEIALKNEQRIIDMRKLQEALKPHPHAENCEELPASAKLAEAILRAQRTE